jgi:hypothetical protein
MRLFYIYLLVICFANTSCKKLIEVPPNPADRIATGQAFSDSTNVLNVMAGLYSNFTINDAGFAFGIYNGGVTAYTALTGDELINLNPNLLHVLTPYYKNSLQSDNAYLSMFWADAYKTIYIVNASFESLPKSTGLSESFRQQVTGEFKTLRAFTYFQLVNIFGGVPIITGTDFRVNSRLPRETEAKVYEFIVADLEAAIKLLKPEYPSDGHARPNLFTAKALLAKVYLYLKNWQKAEVLAGEVIDAGLYYLEPDPNRVFLSNSTESIWQYPATDAGFSETNEGYVFNPEPGNIPDYEMTQDMLNAFETGDLRRTSWVAEADVNGTLYYHPFKYKRRTTDLPGESEGYIFLRLGEQYLIRAEARANLDQSDDAVEDVNTIRRRAGLGDISFIDKETLLASIMQERRIELFVEWGNRWFDMKRTNQSNAVFGTKPNWQPTDILYPVPKSEILNNTALLQNPGY